MSIFDNLLNLGSSIQSIGSELRSLSGAIQKLKQQREKAKECPIPLDDHIAMMHEDIDAKAVLGRQQLQLHFSAHSKCYQNSVGSIFCAHGTLVVPGKINENILCLFLGNVIKENISKEVRSWPWHKEPGPARANRAAVLAKLDKEISELESRYDDLRAKAENAGIDINRLGAPVRSKKHDRV